MQSSPSGPIPGRVLVLVYSYYHLRFLAPPGLKGKTKMRKMIGVVAVALAVALLGGCAGGGIAGSSPLPSTALSSMHSLDSVGGGPVVAGGPSRMHSLDSVGGGPVVAGRHSRMHSLDSVGGGPVPAPGS